MTKDEMIKKYFPHDADDNYNEAQRRIRKAMMEGKDHVFLPGRFNLDDYEWNATYDTISRLEDDGFKIDTRHKNCEGWTVEWHDEWQD